MIPKIIHYCWFGTKPLSSLELACIESWKKYCPEYKFVCWNESSFDVTFCKFSSEAFLAGNYAFVSDVARVWALYKHGGIYLDTDMLLLSSLDEFLDSDFFIGEHLPGKLGVGAFGCSRGHGFLKRVLDVYVDSSFSFGAAVLIPDVFDQIYKDDFLKHGLTIYPPTVFYPLPFENKGDDFHPFLTLDSKAVHLWNHSWKDEFGLLKENLFGSSLSVAIKHFALYPEAYRNLQYVKKYFSTFFRSLKRYLKSSLHAKA